MNFKDRTESIKIALIKLYSFMQGIEQKYTLFEFDKSFDELYQEVRNLRVFTDEYNTLYDEFHAFISQVYTDLVKSDYKITKVYKNSKYFSKDCDSIIWYVSHSLYGVPIIEEKESRLANTLIYNILTNVKVPSPNPIEFKTDHSSIKTDALLLCLEHLPCYNIEKKKKGYPRRVFKPNMKFWDLYVYPLQNELESNLLQTEKTQGKRDILAYYIDKFQGIDNYFSEFKEMLAVENMDYYNPIKHELINRDGNIKRLNGNEEYAITCHILFCLIFTCIYQNCKKYKIDFFEICSATNFSLEYFDDYENNNPFFVNPYNEHIESQKLANEPNFSIVEGKPNFVPEIQEQLFDILKDFFNIEDQMQLKLLFKTGNNAPVPLIFNGTGNRFANALKQLKEVDFITGCKKTELENWIKDNFQYVYQNHNSSFKPHYLEDLISTDKLLCKNPIFTVILNKETGKHFLSKT